MIIGTGSYFVSAAIGVGGIGNSDRVIVVVTVVTFIVPNTLVTTVSKIGAVVADITIVSCYIKRLLDSVCTCV